VRRVQQAGAGLVGQVVARPFLARRRVADDGHLTDAGVAGANGVGVQPQAPQTGRARRGQQQVAPAEPIVQLSAAVVRLEVEGQDLLALMELRVPLRPGVGQRVAGGGLDLHHGGAQVDQSGGGQRTGQVDGQRQDVHSFEGSHDGLRNLWVTIPIVTYSRQDGNPDPQTRARRRPDSE
jgi:hypothetical protein